MHASFLPHDNPRTTRTHPLSDLTTAKAVYAAPLGILPQTDKSCYVGGRCTVFGAASLDWGGEALLVATPYCWFRISSRRI